MSLTLGANISADAKTLTITGTVPASVDVGYTFRLDDEAMIVKGFAAGTGPYHGFGAHTNVNAWVVSRGQLGTTRATHTAGATVEAAVDAYVEGTDPFAAATGGSGPVLVHTTNIAHADILTLPSTPVEVLAAQGAGTAVIPVLVLLRSFPYVADYTNISATSNLSVGGGVDKRPVRGGDCGSSVRAAGRWRACRLCRGHPRVQGHDRHQGSQRYL